MDEAVEILQEPQDLDICCKMLSLDISLKLYV